MPALLSYEVEVTYKVKSVRAISAAEAHEKALAFIDRSVAEGRRDEITESIHVTKEF